MSNRIRDVLARHSMFIGVFVVLVAALAITYGARTWRLSYLKENLDAVQAATVAAVQSTIQKDFDRRVASLRQRAQQLARQPAVIEGLRAHQAGARPEQVVDFAARQSSTRQAAVEFYGVDHQLVAWNGFNMPLDTLPKIPSLDPGITRIVQDGDVRWALAVWRPVRHEGAVIGAVRAMQLVRFRAPVQNQFIEDYSLEQRWRVQAGYPIDVTWGASEGEADSIPLRAGGSLLGRIDMQPPSGAQLQQMERRWFNNIAMCWITGLLFWLFAALWMVVYRWGTDHRSGQGIHMKTVWGFAAVAVAWWGLRYILIALDVPDRWQSGKTALAPLFDPTHLASPIGGGVMASTGDLLVTGAFALLFTAGFIGFAARFRVHVDSLSELWGQIRITSAPKPSLLRFLGVVVIMGGVELGLVYVLASLARRAVLDSTLDFFARTGLLPEPLVLAVLCGLLMVTVAVILCGAGVFWIALYALGRYRPSGWSAQSLVLAVLCTLGGVLVTAFALVPPMEVVAVPVAMAYFAAILGVALLGMIQRSGVVKHFTLRSLLPGIIVLTTLLYPMLYQGMDAQRRGRMVDATASFVEGSDPRVMFSLEQVLQRARASRTLRAALQGNADDGLRADSAASELLQGSLIASLSQYEASLQLVDSTGAILQSYATAGRQSSTTTDDLEAEAFETLRARYTLHGHDTPIVERIADRRQQSRFQYVGLVAVEGTGGALAGWMVARAEPRSLLPGTGTPYPRVLLPEGLYGNLVADLALAEFRDGVLVRSLGDFGRAQLTQDVRAAFQNQPSAWRTESFEGRRYLVHYRQEQDTPDTLVAARMPAIMAFDHLYYLLRLAIAGVCIGGPFYLLGLYLRYRQGMLPAPRVRFRDKMLDAFLVVGSIAVVAVGVVGARVIVQENERAVRNQLQQNLDRVEEALLMEAQRGEMLYRIAERTRIDSLARRVGLDLNLYEDGRLVASSRPRLVRDRLIDMRLPAAAYQALHMDAYRFTTTEEQFGAFTYTVGFQALPDETGAPRYVLAVPTLPEQERIQEERARTLAYLLGALLLLIVVIMLTALFLSNALAQPIARLRAGLEAVGEGRYAQRLPVDTRDEIGELVQTFNEMREQLAESRRRLAQQERELAWREMARQVAHEIKNPLTPMKLSVQHMRRAFQRLRVPEPEGAPADDNTQQFADLFNRITNTLIEQIDTLARIANEFSSFARLPERVLEPLDVNDVMREAAALMKEGAEVTIELDLHDAPLMVQADREELRRIYINLIKNAMQAVPDHRDGHIRIATAPDADTLDAAQHVQSWVSDNGVGIPPDQRDHIFQPNFSTKTSGTGLGLAIAQKTVRELGGEIGFQTEPGEGTTFWIRLPLQAAGEAG